MNGPDPKSIAVATKLCDLTVEVEPGYYKCPECGLVGIKGMLAACGESSNYDARNDPQFKDGTFIGHQAAHDLANAPLEPGPGKRLSDMFHAMGFPPCARCLDTARKMNERGDQGCRDSIDTIVSEIKENIGARDDLSRIVKALAKLKGIDAAIKTVVLSAIDEGYLYQRAVRYAD